MPISKINTTSITDNSVTAGKIVAGAVDADIAAGSIDTAQIADDAVTTAKIPNDAVTADKLANAINTSIDAKLPLSGGTITGNVGVGVTPTDFQNRKSLDIGLGGKVWGLTTATETGHGNNFYFDGAYKRIATGVATRHIQDSSGHTFDVVASGNANSTISWNTAALISPTGIVTKPYQPAFSSYANTAQNNLSTGYNTINFDTERFDINSNFNTSTHTFTAPVTGKYMFAACVGLRAIPENCNWIFMQILTSNQGYNISTSTAQWDSNSNANYTTGFASSVLADMDSGDTASVRVYQYTGSTQTDVTTGAGYTWFTGCLVA